MKKILLIVLACVFMAAPAAGHAEENKPGPLTWPTVATEYGPVRGVNENGVSVFRGIPFAQPPVGQLRFAPPKNPQPWTAPLDCAAFPNVPVQESDTSPYQQSEDCLYLNIWAPENARGKSLPVLVFIHGGGYSFGHASNSLYDGRRFALDGVVQVNVAYRLNALGFMPILEAGQESGYAANIGTLDQIQALKWVKENIASFGGDAGNITISGESAGAFSVASLVLSPLAKGLFNRAIMQSGNTLGQNVMMPKAKGDLDLAVAHANEFARSLSALNQDGQASLEKLRALSARELSRGSYLSMDFTRPSPYHFFTVFDGRVLPENPYQALVEGRVNEVPILTGFNTDEGTMFIPDGTTVEQYKEILRGTFGERADEVFDRYPVDINHTATERARDIIRMGLRMGGDLMAEVFSGRGQDVYCYQFDYSLPELDQKGLGTMHALELPFVFDTLSVMGPWFSETAPRDLSFQKTVHTYWLNFIKTGDPNQGQAVAVHWPKYTRRDKMILILDEVSREAVSPGYEDVDYFSKLSWGASPY